MSHLSSAFDRAAGGFPRLRGDEPTDRFARYLILEFSPPTRG